MDRIVGLLYYGRAQRASRTAILTHVEMQIYAMILEGLRRLM